MNLITIWPGPTPYPLEPSRNLSPKRPIKCYALFVVNPLNQRIYAGDPAFEPVRNQIDAEMRKKPEPD